MNERIGASKSHRFSAVLLLVILAACGYIGANSKEAATVSVAVSRQVLHEQKISGGTSAGASNRLREEREAEIALLREILQSHTEGEQIRADALEQMKQITDRMEIEAETIACLQEMGFEECAAVCGAQMMHIITPYENVTDDRNKNRMIDAVCGVTGYDPADIKIILTKK